MLVLVLNCGSSSLKFALIETQSHEARAKGLVENLGTTSGKIKAEAGSQKHTAPLPDADHRAALAAVTQWLREAGVDLAGLGAVGHRVVHGGERFSGSVLVNEAVLEGVRSCSRLAPLHNPANLVGIEVATSLFPSVPQIAVFDTAFHQTLPPEAFLYPIPMELYQKQGIRRYGFHGTSHRFVSIQAAAMLGKRPEEVNLITAHLGNGCSATAIRQGRSVDTTMGLTPLEGLVMGTRSGNIDPGIPKFLNETLGYDFARIDKLLNKESGLLGLSGLSHDMRTLSEAAGNGHEGAERAIAVFCRRLASQIAGLSTALPSLDALVFTGGIGENSALVRSRTVQQLKILGLSCDESRNTAHGRCSQGRIDPGTGTAVLVVPTDEELLIALDSEKLVYPQPDQPRTPA